jgi:hypothetical protein
MANDKDQLLAAEHQLLGFFHAQEGGSLRDLIRGMALTQEEFRELMATGAVAQLSDDDLAEIHEILKGLEPVEVVIGLDFAKPGSDQTVFFLHNQPNNVTGYSFEQVRKAAETAKEECAYVTGQHRKIKLLVNATQIAHTVCGTDLPASTATDASNIDASDTERIDWLEAQRGRGGVILGTHGQVWVRLFSTVTQHMKPQPTVRAAIDEAIEKGKVNV